MRWLRHPSAVAAALVLVVSLAVTTSRSDAGLGMQEVFERWSLDARFRARGPVAAHPDVALVLFDAETTGRAVHLLDRRAGWARVVRAAKSAGAKVIGVDALFDAPEQLLSPALMEKVAAWQQQHPEEGSSAEDALLRDVAAELDGDGELEAALREAGNVVLILHQGLGESPEGVEDGLSRARYAQSTPPLYALEEAGQVTASLQRFTSAAKGMGFATFEEDDTRTLRRTAFVRSFRGGLYLPFTVPAAALYLGLNRGALAYLGPQQEVRLGERAVKLEADGAWLNYRGPAESYATYSAVDLVQGRIPEGALAGKVVLLGVTGFGYDKVRTPYSQMSGVEVQATALDNLLNGDFLHRTSAAMDLAATAGLGLLVALLFSVRRLHPAVKASAAAAVVGGWWWAATWLFVHARTWVGLVGPTLSVTAAAMAGLGLSYTAEALQRRQLKDAFGRYVGEDVLGELLQNPSALALGGERRRLTVLFSDIRGFTTFSEALPPDKLVAVLNTYLSPMTRAVLAQGGLLDKYIGDAVMAVFGAPLRSERHAAQSLACVLQMHAELEALNAGPLRALSLHFEVGVGLNTGDMVVGNMGAEMRFDYTVAGDAVNLASRLEGLTKTYGVFCLLGDATHAWAPPEFQFRALDLVQVKGKSAAVPVWELLSGPGRVVARYEKPEAWDAGVAAFREGRLAAAREAFQSFAGANPADKAVALYLERLEALPADAPPDFSPVAVFKTK